MTIDDKAYQEAVDYVDYLEFKLIQAELDCKAKVAAAYEMAALKCEYIIKNIEILKPDGETYETPRVHKIARGLVDLACQDIRALATPDQTAALDRVKAEAKAEGMRHAANIAGSIGGKDHPDSIAYDVEKAILDAIPKGD